MYIEKDIDRHDIMETRGPLRGTRGPVRCHGGFLLCKSHVEQQPDVLLEGLHRDAVSWPLVKTTARMSCHPINIESQIVSGIPVRSVRMMVIIGLKRVDHPSV